MDKKRHKKMVQRARIRLLSKNTNELQMICDQLKEIAQKTGARMNGPIPLPTKKINITVRKAPSKTGSKTWDHFQMRVHKRILILDANERTMSQIMRIRVPDDVFIEIELV
jgi:small subunit ribosomal protein S10